MNRATALILDVLAYGAIKTDYLLLGEREYSLNFNRPWHGLDKVALIETLSDLRRLGYIFDSESPAYAVSKEIHNDFFSVTSLTGLGGEIWESVYEVNWDLYSQIIHSCTVNKGVGDYYMVGLRSTNREHLCCVIDVLRSKYGEHEIDSGAIRSKGAWEWSNWKIHNECYEVALERLGMRAVNEKFEVDLVSSVESANYGWIARLYGAY